MRPTVIFRPGAVRDLQDTFEWYELRQPGLGDLFEIEIARVLERVQDNPLAYPRVHGSVHRALTRRFPQAVFYLVESDRIVVIAVLHGKRHPNVSRRRR